MVCLMEISMDVYRWRQVGCVVLLPRPVDSRVGGNDGGGYWE